MKKILVYMAVYNGERFLKAQLDSVLAQQDVAVDILIADDGSTDATCRIIEDWSAPNITLLRNSRNKGYRKNFWDLICRPLEKDYDYFALCDHDDVWLPDKLSAAVSMLDGLPRQEPNLYCSNLKLVDGDLNPLGANLNPPVNADTHAFILQNICTGCTAVFNNALRNLLLRFPAERLIVPHDNVIARIALLCGNFIYDNDGRILYRQHGSNQIGVNTAGRLAKYANAVYSRKSFPHSENLRDIHSLYQAEIHPALERWLAPLLTYKSSLSARLRLVAGRDYGSYSLPGTLKFKAAFLLKRY